MRTVPVLAVTGALVAALLSGCSTVQASTECAIDSGASSDLVTSTGAAGTRGAAQFPTPIHSRTTQRTVLADGSGTTIGEGDVVGYRMTLYDGQTGDVRGTLGTRAQPDYGTASANGVQVSDGQTSYPLRGVGTALQCTRVGSTLSVILTARDLGSLAQSDDDTWVVVIHPSRALAGAATGARRVGEPGFPGVVTAPNGRPGVIRTDPNSPALTTVRTEETKSGSGPTVGSNDVVFVKYVGVSYPAIQEISNSWAQDSPTYVQASSTQTAQDLPGQVTAQLAGKKVGSQLMVLVPAKQGGQTTGGDAAYVVDILGIAQRR